MEQQQKAPSRTVKRKPHEPNKCKVIVLNDDYTTFEFVVRMLVEIFFMETSDAESATETIDREGSAVVGTYPRDIAESKAAAGIAMARAEHFPLRITTEDA